MKDFEMMDKIHQKRLECKLAVLESFVSNFDKALKNSDSAMLLALAESLKTVIK
ncbi:TPA: hypothetical protein O2E65_001530 [Listeria monocytogenes]|uniref:hypothetical protein n=1 Tax=Listeria monocytogenes TaxID=1639 RepID=UPI00164FA94F|nr:hypothetical protein [Listeria monocytogenes]EIL9238499.1 hypothetical protein [Listeria monocytogenes]HCY9071789.1 hypothetical protein [Listeria monocytogenes]